MPEMNPSDASDAPKPTWQPQKQSLPEPPAPESEPDAADAAEWQLLSRLIAERAMAEITPREWVDLRSVKATRYEPGSYQTQPSPSDDPQPYVRLTWLPGRILLSETLKIDQESALILPLPSVRHPLEFRVIRPPPGLIPQPPAQQSQGFKWVHQNPAEQQEKQMHDQAWTEYVRPQMEIATQLGIDSLAETQTDEETIARLAMQDIQARRMNPTEAPKQTIAAALETAAETMRTDTPQ